MENKAKIISIGMTCCPRWILRYVYYKQDIQTNFFDWIVCRESAVSVILSLKDPQKTFSEDRIEIVNKTEARFLDIPTFRSIHDIDEKKTPKEAKKILANMYKRRYERLIADIKTEKQIFFLRWQKDHKPWNEEQIDKFFNHLYKIKEGSQHYLVSVGLNGNQESQKRLEEKHRYKFFNLHDYPQTKAEPTHNWCHDQYDWSKVFLWINENKI